MRSCIDLSNDQYGNYVVQHIMEHSSRPGDRQMVMRIVRDNILTFSCHKYASNVIEKAIFSGTGDERAQLIHAIIGQDDARGGPLLTMTRDKFGNYIVQRAISLSQGQERRALLQKLQEHMPALKKSNSYGKHIVTAVERALAGIQD